MPHPRQLYECVFINHGRANGARPLFAEFLEKLELPRIKGKYGVTGDNIADLFVVRSKLE